jgi:predicted glycosyltransferase
MTGECVWVDIDNAPQVQYLCPLADELARRGHQIVVTARDQGMTLELLESRATPHVVVGSSFGRSRVSKAVGVTRRGAALTRLFRNRARRPTVLISSSRSSALAARLLGIPSFVICDYEHVDLSLYRRLAANLLFPNVIDAQFFVTRGLARERLLPFPGIKEHITFSGARLDAEPHRFEDAGSSELVRVILRLPAAESHYYVEKTGSASRELLSLFASCEDCVVIASPRYEWQAHALRRLSWKNQPVVLEHPIPFMRLLVAADLVVSSGGTLAREAAFLGIPSYSAFAGVQGGVDRYLQSIGRLTAVANDVGRIRITKRGPLSPLESRVSVPGAVIDSVLGRVRDLSGSQARHSSVRYG